MANGKSALAGGRGLRLLLVALLLLLVAGAVLFWPRASAPRGNLEGAAIGGDFALTDESGRPVISASYAGLWRLMYFGFTFCPDICPTDTAKLAAGLAAFEKAQPARAARVQPLFVTVDPQRDTPQALAAFTDSFHPRLVGLTGTPDQVAATLATFRIYARRVEGATPGSYLFDHMAAIYLFDPAGRPVAFIPGPEATPAAVAAMLEAHVR